jgi:flagellar basal body-associated protein FliL
MLIVLIRNCFCRVFITIAYRLAAANLKGMAETNANPSTSAATDKPAAPADAAGTPAAGAPAPDSTPRKKSKAAGLGGTIVEVLAGLKSSDKPTRNGAILFVVSLCGIAFVIGLAGMHVWEDRKNIQVQMNQSEQGKNLDEFIKKQAEEAKKKYSMQTLGTFTIQLKVIEGQKPAPGVMNLAEIEIQAKCDEVETCQALDEGSAQVRNEITSSLGPMDRDELLTKEGKHRLKKKLLDRLNAWLPKGKIEDLYFSKLVIS